MSDARHDAIDGIGNAPIDKFLAPEAMLTPGAAGGITMVIATALANNFDLTPHNRSALGLLLSFMFGLLVMASHRQLLTRIIYYVLNSLIIFVVAFGANNLVAPPSSPPPANPNGTAYTLFPSAYAQGPDTSKNFPEHKKNSDEVRGESTGTDTQHPSQSKGGANTGGNSGRDVQNPDHRSRSFFQPWVNPFTR